MKKIIEMKKKHNRKYEIYDNRTKKNTQITNKQKNYNKKIGKNTSNQKRAKKAAIHFF